MLGSRFKIALLSPAIAGLLVGCSAQASTVPDQSGSEGISAEDRPDCAGKRIAGFSPLYDENARETATPATQAERWVRGNGLHEKFGPLTSATAYSTTSMNKVGYHDRSGRRVATLVFTRHGDRGWLLAVAMRCA